MQEQKPNKYKNKRASISNRKGRGKALRYKRSFSIKLSLLSLFFVLLFFCLIGRMFYLQVLASDDLTRRALRQMTKSEMVKPERGLIFDRDKKRMVSNITRSNVLLDGKALKESDTYEKDKKAIESYMKKNFPESLAPLRKAIEDEKVSVVARGLDRNQAMELSMKNYPGIVLEDYEARSYPFSNLASHIIGFTDREGKGLYGIEAYYDDLLSGISGKNIVFKDTQNKKMPGTEGKMTKPHKGLSVVLTVSEPIQKTLEDTLEEAKKKNKAKRISAIIQDTNTGAILAMGSTDSYDLNAPRGPQNFEQKQTWKNLSQKQKQEIWYDNWRAFTVSDLYEPGSTFKTITAAAALEEATTDPKKHYYCTGYIRDLRGITITCTSLPNPHGDIIMADAFAQSCNTTFVNIARELGKESLYKYIKAFGFGQITGIDLPGEEKGIVPKSEKDISDVRLATMSYGHGIAVTPIQMVTAISAVANGGYLMEPYLVSSWVDDNGEVVKEIEPHVKRQVISQSTSDSMRELLALVVEEGTGSLGGVNGYKVGGKTGTADKVSESGGYEKGKYISSFVSVAPIDDPKYTVLVIVEEPEGDYYGATVAAPINSKLMEATLRYNKVQKSKDQEAVTQKMVLVPDVRNLLLEDAGKLLLESGLKFNAPSEEIGDFSLISSQSPAPGTEVEEGTVVDLTLDPNDSNKKKIPKLIGKSKEEVETILKKTGFSYVIEGEGLVIEQNPNGGQIVKEETKIFIKLAPPLDNKDNIDDNSTDSSGNEKESKGKIE